MSGRDRRRVSDSDWSALMRRAIALARRGRGRVEPNPMVGCVLVRGGRVIGEGYHRRFGGPHAEVNALRSCGGRAAGATAVVTLEPCCIHAKTPPCTEALLAAGVSRVVVGSRDPNPRVDGGGIGRLRRAGVEVIEGVEGERAAALLAPFRTYMLEGRPYVIAKWAQSLDGRTATGRGDSQWISCDESRRYVHRVRACMDGVAVGANTVRVDDPRLTARGVAVRRSAARVVWDTRLTLSPASKLVRSAGRQRTIVLTSREMSASRKAARLSAQGVEVIGCRLRGGCVSVRDGLRRLHKMGMTNLLVEGGATLLASFFRESVVDEALAFVAPLLIGGGDARSAVDDFGVARMSDALRPTDVEIRKVGVDRLYRMSFRGSVPPA